MLCRIIFVYFLCFSIYNNVYLDLVKAIKKMFVNDIGEFIFENYYKQIGFSKESNCYPMKRSKRRDLLLFVNKFIQKIPDPRNAIEKNKSFLSKKNRKSVKQSEMITYEPKTENPNIYDIKSVIKEHPKTSYKLSKTIKKGENVASNSSLYSDTKKRDKFLNKKI